MRKNERGSVTLIVTVTVMFILIILSASLMFVSTKRKAQLQESQILQNVYGGDLYETYTERSQKLSYNNCISNNLLVYYDAINNTGSGHSNTVTTWKNLAGDATFDGKITGATFYNNYLSFDGVDDWVAIGNLSGKKSYTLDFTVMFLNDATSNIFCNVDGGGIGFFMTPELICFQVCTAGSYKNFISKEPPAINKVTHYVGTYDGSHLKLYINGIVDVESDVTGQFDDPLNNTIFALGGNPHGNTVDSEPLKKMYVYSCRLYDRALSDAEVKHNFEVDRARYMIEE